MKLSKYIDHTNIDEKTTKKDILKSCQEAKKYNFRGLCVRKEWTKLVKENLKVSDVKTITLIDPPLGTLPHEKRIEIAKKAKKDGSDEIDVVMNIVDFKKGNYEKVLNDLKEICKILPTKIIIGSGYLTDEEIKKACEIVKKSGAICIKTATEKDPLSTLELEEKARHIKIMKEFSDGLLVKASGAIRNLRDTIWMIESGADIIGTSSGVEIIEEAKKIL